MGTAEVTAGPSHPEHATVEERSVHGREARELRYGKGGVEAAMADVVFAHAEQNRRDHRALVAAIAAGRVRAVEGV